MISESAGTGARSTAPVLTFDLVPFEGTDILAGRDGDTVFVPMKSFCGSLGLPWDGQRRRLQRDEMLREGAVIMTIPSAGGDQRQTTLPLDLIPGFLMGAESTRYAPELQARIRTYRRSCYQALARHFFGPGPAAAAQVPEARPSIARETPDAPAAIANAIELVQLLRAEAPGPVRTFYQQLLDQSCANVGLAPPLVPIDPPTELSAAAVIDRLLLGLRTLDARKVPYNHFGAAAAGLIALNLPQLARLFARHDIDVPIDDALRAALDAGDRRYRVKVRSIPSALRIGRRAVLCHVIERAVGGEL